jgi:hypothetical protein
MCDIIPLLSVSLVWTLVYKLRYNHELSNPYNRCLPCEKINNDTLNTMRVSVRLQNLSVTVKKCLIQGYMCLFCA